MHDPFLLAVRPTPLSIPLICRLNKVLAMLMMVIIICATILIWPITYLGYGSTFVTNEIFYIEPDGPAERAGLRIGDRILMLYDRPIEEVISSINIIALIGSSERPVPIVVGVQELSDDFFTLSYITIFL